MELLLLLLVLSRGMQDDALGMIIATSLLISALAVLMFWLWTFCWPLVIIIVFLLLLTSLWILLS